MDIMKELKMLYKEVGGANDLACHSLDSEWCNECPYFFDDEKKCAYKEIKRHVKRVLTSISQHRYDEKEEVRIIEELKKIYEEIEDTKNIGCNLADGCYDCIDYGFDKCVYECLTDPLINIINFLKTQTNMEEKK